VLDVVDQLDLEPFYLAHRNHGHGHPPTTPTRNSRAPADSSAAGCACNAEWKPLCGIHNLLKLWRHTLTQPAARAAAA
jgi:hypothetical protein